MLPDLLDEEKDLLLALSGYPRVFANSYDDNLNYLMSLGLASKHANGWAKGFKTDQVVRVLKQRPIRNPVCKNCGA